MKKIIYLISLLLLSLTACNEDFNGGIFPQTNPQEDSLSFKGLTVKLGSSLSTALDLSKYKPTDTLDVIEATATPNLSKKAHMEYVMQISATADYAKLIELDAQRGKQLVVDSLNTAFRNLLGKSPKQRDVFVRFKAYITEGTSRVRYGEYFDFKSVKITPIPLSVKIEDSYSIVTNAGGTWSVNNMLRFNHSDNDPYDDPIFTLTFQILNDNTKLKIVSQSLVDKVKNNQWEGVLGATTDGTTELKGNLTTTNGGSIVIAKAQWVKVTLNMMTYQYTIELLGQISPYLWTPGAHQGWSPATSTKLYSANMNLVYTGYTYLTGEFKLTSAPDWSHTNYGVKAGKLDTAGDNLSVASAGFYHIVANLSDMSYAVTSTQWGLIGSATPGDWTTSTPMTYNSADNSWSVTANLIVGEYKFRANNDWALNMGGAVDHLKQGGDNLKVDVAGNYTIKLYLTNDETSYCTVTKN